MPPTHFPVSACLYSTDGSAVAPGGALRYCAEGSGMQWMCEILDLVLLLVYIACLLLIKSMFGKPVDLSQNEQWMKETPRFDRLA